MIRGINRQKIFEDEEDCEIFIQILNNNQYSYFRYQNMGTIDFVIIYTSSV